MSRADEFRKNADECRQQAAKSFNPLDKERWLMIAEHWLRMAQEADAAPITRTFVARPGRRDSRRSAGDLLRFPDYIVIPSANPVCLG